LANVCSASTVFCWTSGSFLQLDDLDAAVHELLQRRRDVLITDGLVTDVEDDAHVVAHRLRRVRFVQPGLLCQPLRRLA
jgi:hypothetical protein